MATGEGNLVKGDSFSTFAEVLQLINKRKLMFNEKLVKSKRCKTVGVYNKGVKEASHLREDLSYANVEFRCVHEGTFTSRGKEKQTTSMKNDCPVHIRLHVNRVLDKLEVVSVNLEHNHILPKKTDGVYSEDRKLDKDQEETVRHLLDNKVTVGNILRHCMIRNGSNITTKDVHNLRSQMERERIRGLTAEEQVWELLHDLCEEDEGFQYSLITDRDEKEIEILFVQSSYMRHIFQSYPDVLYIDGTYCLNRYNYPLYVFLVVDGDNTGHVVGYALVKDETCTLSSLFCEFVRKSGVSGVKTVVVDKDQAEIEALKCSLPDANIVLCRFHVQQAFKNAIASKCNKFEQDEVKKLVHKMVYCSKQETFHECVQLLPANQFKTYILKNWLPIKETWANCFTKHLITWGNKTNNFVERRNRTLKQIASAKTSLPDLLRALMVQHRQDELRMRQRLQVLALRSKTIRAPAIISADILNTCCERFTPSAVEMMKNEWKRWVEGVEVDVEDKLVFLSRDGKESLCWNVSNGCECLFFLDTGLPCWHMYAFALKSNFDILSFVPERYSKKKLFECFTMEHSASPASPAGRSLCSLSVQKKATKTEVEKRSVMNNLLKEVLTVGVQCGQGVFEERCEVLKKLFHSWNSNSKVDIVMGARSPAVAGMPAN